MTTVESVLAGRKLVDDYRKTRPPSGENKREIQILLDGLKALGFDSIDSFYEANKETVRLDVLRCQVAVGVCDNCEGRVRKCPFSCYQMYQANKTEESITKSWSETITEGITKVEIQPYLTKFVSSIDEKEYPIIDGCSVRVKNLAKPALDWSWY